MFWFDHIQKFQIRTLLHFYYFVIIPIHTIFWKESLRIVSLRLYCLSLVAVYILVLHIIILDK
jgi:hypothetical protein